jgi:CBS domain-containing protein
MAQTARDVMTGGAECVGENETLADAARKMKDLDVGSLPICGEDQRLKGMITDRDIVLEAVAEGRDPADVKASDLGGEEVVTIGADDSISEALKTMADHKVRRLPVIDGHELIGVVSFADLAGAVEDDDLGQVVETITASA